MSERDCIHGRQLGKCDTCDLEEILDKWEAEQAANKLLTAKLQAAEAEAQRMREDIHAIEIENEDLRTRIAELEAGLRQIASGRNFPTEAINIAKRLLDGRGE